eukprot:364100-Chlamydomonas_euryale.AAC.23
MGRHDTEVARFAVEYIREHWPWWDRYEGGKHIVVQTGDMGRNDMYPPVPELYKNVSCCMMMTLRWLPLFCVMIPHGPVVTTCEHSAALYCSCKGLHCALTFESVLYHVDAAWKPDQANVSVTTTDSMTACCFAHLQSIWLHHWGLHRRHDYAGWAAAHRPGLDIVIPVYVQPALVKSYGMVSTHLHPGSQSAAATKRLGAEAFICQLGAQKRYEDSCARYATPCSARGLSSDLSDSLTPLPRSSSTLPTTTAQSSLHVAFPLARSCALEWWTKAMNKWQSGKRQLGLRQETNQHVTAAVLSADSRPSLAAEGIGATG